MTARFFPIALVLLSFSLAAQQPNGALASLTLNGADGPPWPIATEILNRSAGALAIRGASIGTPVWLAASETLDPGTLSAAEGLVDLDWPHVAVLIDGSAQLDGSGRLDLAFVVPADLPDAWTVGLQALVLTPASASGATLTAATLATAHDHTGADLTLSDDGWQGIDLAPFGLEIAFYETSYSQVFVNANGSVSFVLGDGGFVASPTLFLQQHPKIAAFWTDLSPAPQSVRWELELNAGAPLFRARWTNVISWGGFSLHNFSIEVEARAVGSPAARGNIAIDEDSYHMPSVYDTVVGISPGMNLNGAIPIDLSAGNHPGSANQALYEFFAGTASVTGLPGSTWDLTGTRLDFLAVNPGSPGASYTIP